jgi:hypothetical protein
VRSSKFLRVPIYFFKVYILINININEAFHPFTFADVSQPYLLIPIKR